VGTLDLTPSRDDIQQTNKGKNLMAAVGAALKVEIDKLQKRLMATTDLAEWLTGLRVFSVLGLPDGNRRLHDRTYEQVIDWRGLPCGKSWFFLNTGDSRYVVGVLNGLSISTARATKPRRRRFEPDIVCIGNIDQRGYVSIGARQEDTSGTGNGAPQNAASPGLVVRVPKGSFALYNGRVIQVVNRAWRKAGRPTGLTWRPTGTRSNGKTWGWCVVVEADTAADVAKVLPWTAGLPVWEPELGKVTVRGDRVEAVQKTSSLLYRCVSSSGWKRRGSWKLLIPAERKELSNGRDPLLYVTLRDGEVNSGKVYYEVSKAIVKLVGGQVFGIRAAELELVKAHPKLGPRLKDAYVAALTKADDVLRSAGITCPCDSEAERNISSSARAVAYLDDEFVSGIRGFEASKYGQVRKQVRTHIVVGRDDGAKSAALLIRRTFGSVVDGENSSGIVAKLCGEADKTSPLLASVLQHGRTYGLSKSEMPELALLLKQHVKDSK